ncbi:hypothetical protein ACM66B_005255 [Microbotryomycetes sp. NB124-2]
MPVANRGSGEKKFKCPECDKSFSRTEYVKRHIKTAHTGERPYVCSLCSASFARTDLLTRHEKACVKSQDQPATAKPRKRMPPTESRSNSNEPSPPQDLKPAAMPFEFTSSMPVPGFTLPAKTDGAPSQSSSNVVYGSSAAGSTSSTSLPPLAMSTSSSYSSSNNSPATMSASYTLSAAQSAPMFSGVIDPPVVPMTATSNPLFGNVTAQDQTLAPGVSRSLSQDELLASEVLEDLLRSPPNFGFPSPPPFSATSDDCATGSGGSSSDDNSPFAPTPPTDSWSGGDLLPTTGLGQVSAWDMYDGAEGGIENSPAALMLADYFNKGGTGGISALDLGFKYEPSIFPDHLYEYQPMLHDDVDRKFYMPPSKFHIGYLMSYKIPSISTLSKYGKQAAEKFLPTVPVVHRGTLKMDEMPGHTAFALTVAGASYSTEGESFSNEMLVEKRVYLVRNFNKDSTTAEEQFSYMQSMLLYQLLGLFHPDEHQRVLSQTFQGALVSMLRQLDLPNKIREASKMTPSYSLSGAELDKEWKRWVQVETWRRVCFLVFLCDLEMASKFGTQPYLSFTDVAADLPSSESLWNAQSADEWLPRICSPLNPTSVSFLEAISTLLDPVDPTPFEAKGILLAELSRLDQFPLLILTRALSFLQTKTEQALAQIDPVRMLTGGIGLMDGRESDHRVMLRNIQKARERLRRIPGGHARGNGEGWFAEAMPCAAKAAAGQQPTPPSDKPSPPFQGTTTTTSTTSSLSGSPSMTDTAESWMAIQNMTPEHVRLAQRRSSFIMNELPQFMAPQVGASVGGADNDASQMTGLYSLF